MPPARYEPMDWQTLATFSAVIVAAAFLLRRLFRAVVGRAGSACSRCNHAAKINDGITRTPFVPLDQLRSRDETANRP